MSTAIGPGGRTDPTSRTASRKSERRSGPSPTMDARGPSRNTTNTGSSPRESASTTSVRTSTRSDSSQRPRGREAPLRAQPVDGADSQRRPPARLRLRPQRDGRRRIRPERPHDGLADRRGRRDGHRGRRRRGPRPGDRGGRRPRRNAGNLSSTTRTAPTPSGPSRAWGWTRSSNRPRPTAGSSGRYGGTTNRARSPGRRRSRPSTPVRAVGRAPAADAVGSGHPSSTARTVG